MSTQSYSNNGSHPAGYGIPEPGITHVEAPVSANCRLTIDGYEVQVTVRSGATPGDVEVVMGTMAGLIRAYGNPAALPQVGQPLQAQPAAPPMPPAVPPQASASGDSVPYCFEHGQNYKRHQKDGQVWYSHKIQNPVPCGATWCRYPPPPQA